MVAGLKQRLFRCQERVIELGEKQNCLLIVCLVSVMVLKCNLSDRVLDIVTAISSQGCQLHRVGLILDYPVACV